MLKKENNFAYIDGANLDKALKDLGWRLDYKRFRVWLKEKYGVNNAYIFLGLIPKHKNLYSNLQEAGFILMFKETTFDGEGKIKGNCDADLVLKAAVDFFEKKFDKAVLVSSDGDYACLVQFLKDKDALCSVISPSNKCSFLLRKLNISLVYLNIHKDKLEYKPKRKSPR